MLIVDDLIAAIASPPGPAPRGIIRVAGALVLELLTKLPCIGSKPAFDSKAARRYSVELSLRGVSLKVDLYLWPTNRSYAGQPMAEFHLIGSPPIIDLVLQLLISHGCRLARPGEFTLRSFLAGRIDLTQAEAVLGVIDAVDQSQLDLALSQLAGGLSGELMQIRERLLCDLADLEAGLDFVEEDIDFVSRESLRERLTEAEERVTSLLGQAEGRHRPAMRPVVVLAGLPNAGKSSLFNALIGGQAAIVSGVAGTTRDVVQRATRVGDLEIELIDTAGWEDLVDPVAVQAGDQRRDRIATSDLIVWCTASDLSVDIEEENRRRYAELPRVPDLDLMTKADLAMGGDVANRIRCSTRTGAGLDELRSVLAERLSQRHGGRDEILPSTAVRCRQDLEAARESLQRASSALGAGDGDEILSMELRSALDHLGEVTGAVSNEDVLDRLFSRFCIGK
jgi:tRNA modification GTPase